MFRTSYRKGYPTLVSTKTIPFTKTITQNLFGKEINLYSSTPTLVEYEDGYLFNQRWINYSYHEDGSKKEWPPLIVNLNSRTILDKNFNPISEEVFLQEEKLLPIWGPFGIEDIRIFKYEDTYYYTATCYDTDREVVAVTSGLYSLDTYELPIQPILPSFYTEKRHEKNWAFVVYQNKMAFVYKWYPLELTEIDYETRQLNRLITKPMPAFFKDARGSTPGYKTNSEIWFVVHKRLSFLKNNIHYLQYQHSFVIFDLNMNLLSYSEWFTFANQPVEFCIGIVVKEKEVILSYSLLDTQSFVSVYDSSSLRRLKWRSS